MASQPDKEKLLEPLRLETRTRDEDSGRVVLSADLGQHLATRLRETQSSSEDLKEPRDKSRLCCVASSESTRLWSTICAAMRNGAALGLCQRPGHRREHREASMLQFSLQDFLAQAKVTHSSTYQHLRTKSR